MIKNSFFTSLTVNVTDLPTTKFTISVDKQTIEKILNKLEIKGKELYSELSKNQSQNNKKFLSIKNSFLIYWKKGERIPIDCFITLCKLSDINVLTLQEGITELHSKHSNNGWRINFPITLNKDFFIISEAIRTEGCLMKGKSKDSIQGLAISNKDVFLINLIETILRKLNIDKKSFSRLLHIYCYLTPEQKVDEVIESSTKEKLHFKCTNNRLIFLDTIQDYNIEREYILKINGYAVNLKAEINKNNIITIDSKLHSTGFVSLQIYNSVFARFLHYQFDIPYGIGNKKTFTIDFPFNIQGLPKDILKEIINIVICCEGCVFKHRGTRIIKIKIGSEIYLKKLKQILSVFDIESRISNKNKYGLYTLSITRKNNLIKIKNLIDLYVKYKNIELNRIISSYDPNRVTHLEATKYYLSLLKKYEPTTLKNLSIQTNRNYETLIGVFDRLDKKGFLGKEGKKYIGKGTTPWIYKLSKEGNDYLRK